MELEENVYSLMSGKQFAKEIGRTVVVGTAQTTSVYLGLIAAGVIYMKISKFIKNRKKNS
jgi:hypothetical protein